MTVGLYFEHLSTEDLFKFKWSYFNQAALQCKLALTLAFITCCFKAFYLFKMHFNSSDITLDSSNKYTAYLAVVRRVSFSTSPSSFFKITIGSRKWGKNPPVTPKLEYFVLNSIALPALFNGEHVWGSTCSVTHQSVLSDIQSTPEANRFNSSMNWHLEQMKTQNPLCKQWLSEER